MRPLALVTGGGRRLGAHIAARLGQAGYDLALQSLSGTAPEPWLRDVLGDGAHACFTADLADPEAVSALVPAIETSFGRPIDLLVNCASRFAAFEAGDQVYAAVADHMAINLAAPVALIAAVSARAGPDGAAVVNILDQRIANPPVDQPAYTLSKQALAEATRTLAIAHAPRLRVNGVAPGLVIATPDYTPGQMERIGATMPLGRNAMPEEVADAVLWLAKSRSVTGQVVFVDGGAHLKSFERDFVHLAR